MELAGKRIVVTGGDGFLGRSLRAALAARGCRAADVFVPLEQDFNLVDGDAVRRLYREARPELVFHLAAVVGGIGANRANPGKFFYENLMMGVQLLEEGRRAGLEKLVAVGTICAYPKHTPVPFCEEDLWNGYPEETNAPYGLAKKMLLVQSQAYRQQYGFNSVVLFPVNLYGPCFSGDTDVLTPHGRRNVRDIGVGEQVYSLNPDTHEVEVATVVSLTRNRTDEWFAFRGLAVDYLVTPDHRMYFRTSTAHGFRRAEWFRSRAGRAYGQMVFAHHGPVAGSSPATISLRPYVDARHVAGAGGVRDFKHSHSKVTPLEYRTCDFAEFIGWYVTEGCTRRRTTSQGNESYEIAIAQQHESHRKRIAALLGRMALRFSSNALEFHFGSRLFANYILQEIGLGSSAKHLPRDCFAWGLSERRRLLDAMMLGDGNQSGRRYTTTSPQLADDFCHLAFTCGWKARISNYDGCYRVSIRRRRPETCVKYSDIKVVSVRNEPSYCFTLDRNHIVHAGRNGCLNWVGQCDNFDSASSHVIPALIRKIDDAMQAGVDEVVLWGDGSPTREFLYVDDCAAGLALAAERYDRSEPVNLGAGFEIAIRDLAELIRRLMGYQGTFRWDTSQPNGQPRRRLDVTRAREWFGFAAQVPFEDGLRRTIDWWRAAGRSRYQGRR